MVWKKLSQTEDLISFEKKKKNLNIRIECRLNNKKWEIFKTYSDGTKSSFIEEYQADTKEEALDLVDKRSEDVLKVALHF